MSNTPEQNNAKRTVPGVFAWDMVRKALRAAEEGVFCWMFENDEIFYTEQCVKMMGMTMKDWAPNIFTEPEKTIHPEDVSFFTTAVKRYIGRPAYSTTPLRVEVRLLNQSNRGWRWVRINGLLEYGPDKKPTRLVGVWVDITRRKMADLHAMEDRDLFRTLINYLPDNIYFKNRESRFVIANEATAKKMKVRTPADLIGSRDSNFFDPEMCEIARAEEAQIMETGKPITNRIHHEKWKGGKSTWGRVSKFPWYAADGTVKGIVGISSDVTKLIETQQKYQRIAKQLDEKNKLLEKEIHLAREVQQALQNVFLPDRVWQHSSGSVRKASFHHVYLPSAGVAGDCFEVFPVGQSGVGMLICDVMGHGVRAALIASMMRGLMAQLANLADTPALFLSSLNRQMYRIFSQANITMFASACYVYLDLDRRRLTLASAGHPAPIVLPADARAFQPPLPRTAALGLLENAMFRESEIRLESGMKLMLFTDGLTEAQDATGDEIGAPRIMDFLHERKPRSIREMIDISLAGVHQFTGSTEQDDDICLLGVEFTEE